MKKKTTGLTIAEAMVTLALVVFVLNLTAGLLSSYLNTVEFAGGVDKAMEATQNALNLMRTEAAQAISFSSPAGSGSEVGTLRFSKVYSESSTRLPDPTAPFPSSWEPHDPAWVDTVTYSVANERLLRTSLLESANNVLVADSISDLKVELLPNDNLAIMLSTTQDKIVRTFSTEVFIGLMR